MKSTWFFVIAAIVGLALFSSLPVPIAAATPTTVKLVLDGTGATPWAIGNIAPGNSGTRTVTLSNTGYRDGVVTIWISDIVNGEGANPEPETGDMAEPGELGNYVTLNVSGTNLSADFTLPAKINDFPQNAADTRHLYVTSLKALSAVSLQWEWRLPPETGNDVQGDQLSFTMNYGLEELPLPSTPVPTPLPSTPVPTPLPSAPVSTPLPTTPTPTPLPSTPTPTPGGGAAPELTAGVSIKKTGPSAVFTGFTRGYTLAVTNTGAVGLNDVIVTDYLPALMGYKSAIPAASIITGNQISWNLDTLNIGETKEILVILSGVKSGTAVNTATVTTRESVTSTDSLTITVLGAPGAHMSIVDSADPVAVGDQFTFSITVLNQSESNTLHNLVIAGGVPGEMAYVSADGPTTFTVVGGEVRFGPVVELKPGDTVEFHITVKATSSGSAVFSATMTWDEFGEPIVNQEGTTIFKPEAPRSVQFVSPGGNTTLGVLSDSSTTQSYVATFFENELTLLLDVNTKIAFGDGQPPERIDVNIAQTGVPSGEGKTIVSPVYQISAGYDASGNYQEVNFDRPVTITLRYDPATVSMDNMLLYIACFEGNATQPESGWVRLDYPPGYVPEIGQVSGEMSHLGLFAVMSEPAPSPLLPLTPPWGSPAKFEVRNLTVGSVDVKPGESISISYEVSNTGGQSGEYTLEIKIPGLLQTSQIIKLEAGQTQTLNLTLPTSTPGTYQVEIGGVKDTFTIETQSAQPAPSGIQRTVSGWLIPAVMGVVAATALAYYFVVIGMRRRKHPGYALYAAKHHKRVAELASAIAREMNLSNRLVKMLLKVGIIHNPVSEGSSYPVAQTALQYHQELNGSGYPQKLAGDDIILEARILAVADTVETMSSPRPHRPAISLGKALEEIKLSGSTLYDTEVVKALVRLVNRGNFRFQTSYD